MFKVLKSLKVIIAVLCGGFFNSPIAKKDNPQNSPFGDRNSMVSVTILLKPLCLTSFKGEIMTAKKAIILSYEHSTIELVQLALPFVISCQEHNLELVRIIKAADPYDFNAIRQLIKEIVKQGTPVTVITDMNTYTANIHIPTWCVLGTLLASELVDRFMLYNLEKSRQEAGRNEVVIFEALEGRKYDLLDLSFRHFEYYLKEEWPKTDKR